MLLVVALLSFCYDAIIAVYSFTGGYDMFYVAHVDVVVAAYWADAVGVDIGVDVGCAVTIGADGVVTSMVD